MFTSILLASESDTYGVAFLIWITVICFVVYIIGVICIGITQGWDKALCSKKETQEPVVQEPDSIADMNRYIEQVARSERVKVRKLTGMEVFELTEKMAKEIRHQFSELIVIEGQYVCISFNIHVGEPKGAIKLFVNINK